MAFKPCSVANFCPQVYYITWIYVMIVTSICFEKIQLFCLDAASLCITVRKIILIVCPEFLQK